jgi:tetratricopeptide (TPR) repeat protein
MIRLILRFAFAAVLFGSLPSRADSFCSLSNSANADVENLLRRGKYLEATGILRGLVEELRRDGKKDCALPGALNDLAMAIQNLGRYHEAEELFLHGLRISEKDSDPRQVLLLENLASLYAHRGQIAKAKKLAERLAALPVPAGRDYARRLNTLGEIHVSSQEYLKAEQLFRKALTALEVAGAAEEGDAAILLNNLARVLLEFGPSAEIAGYLNTAIRILEQKVGRDHPFLISPLMNLADLGFTRGRWTDADSFYLRALSISERTLGRDNIKTAEILSARSVVLKRLGRTAEARAAGRRATLIVRSHSRQNFEGHTVDLETLVRAGRGGLP